MKTTLILLFALMIANTSGAQAVQSTCTGDTTLVKRYTGQAEILSVVKIYRETLITQMVPPIPGGLRDTILKAMLAVHNATSLPARDTVINQLNIFNRGPILNQLFISGQKNLDWMNKLKAKEIPTGHAELDELLIKYGMSVESYQDLQFDQIVLLRTDKNYNIYAIKEEFEEVQGIEYAHTNYIIGDGNRITESMQPGYVELVYSYGWGDCPAGCTERRFWKFRVYEDCSVSYEGSYGNVLGTTGLADNNQKGFKAYPNPFTDIINIEGLEKDTRFAIYSVTGQLIKESHSSGSRIEGLGDLGSGVYILELRDGPVSKRIFINKV